MQELTLGKTLDNMNAELWGKYKRIGGTYSHSGQALNDMRVLGDMASDLLLLRKAANVKRVFDSNNQKVG